MFWKSAATSVGLKTTGSFCSWRGYGICSIIHLRMQDVMVEKTQRAYGLVERRPRELFLLDEEQLVIADEFGAQSIGCGSEVLGEVSQAPDVCALGVG